MLNHMIMVAANPR